MQFFLIGMVDKCSVLLRMIVQCLNGLLMCLFLCVVFICKWQQLEHTSNLHGMYFELHYRNWIFRTRSIFINM